MQQKMKLRSRKELFKCVQRADGCLYPIAGTPSASVLAPSPHPLTHAWVISSFLPLSLVSRSHLWRPQWSLGPRMKQKRKEMQAQQTIRYKYNCKDLSLGSWQLILPSCIPLPALHPLHQQLSLTIVHR